MSQQLSEKKQCSIWTELEVHFSCNFCVSPRTSQQMIPSFRGLLTSTTFASSKPILSLDYKQASWQSPASLDCPVPLSMQKNGKWVSLVGYESTGSSAGLFVRVPLQRLISKLSCAPGNSHTPVQVLFVLLKKIMRQFLLCLVLPAVTACRGHSLQPLWCSWLFTGATRTVPWADTVTACHFPLPFSIFNAVFLIKVRNWKQAKGTLYYSLRGLQNEN